MKYGKIEFWIVQSILLMQKIEAKVRMKVRMK